MRWFVVKNHVPGAGSIARPVDRQSSALPLCYECPLLHVMNYGKTRCQKVSVAASRNSILQLYFYLMLDMVVCIGYYSKFSEPCYIQEFLLYNNCHHVHIALHVVT